MKPEQVWQSILSQLQMEMPKAAFDDWVRPTEFVSYDGETYIINAPTPYTRDWLDSRLSSTIVRMLTGILNKSVQLKIVALEDEADNENEFDEDQLDDSLDIQGEYKSIYDEIVRPERVVVFGGYFLRYLPLLGHELAWIYIGFRQSAYEAGAVNAPGKKFSAPAVKVAENAGMSLRTFRRWIAKPSTWNTLRWLVEQVDEKPQWIRGKDGSPHRTASQYRISLSLPLTPFDECSLRTWLKTQLSSGKSSSDAIHSALASPLDELLPWPEEIEPLSDIEGEPHTVQDVVLDICRPVDDVDQAGIHQLADELAQHIMPPKDLVYISHYFMDQWLPRLGPGPGWFVTLLRDRCYINHRTGEIRDEINFEYGYADIARLLGIKRSKTIWEWLREKGLANFVLEAGREEGGEWEYSPRRFKVCLGEPMIPEDRERANRMLAERGIGANVTIREIPIGASDTISLAREQKRHIGIQETSEYGFLPSVNDTTVDFGGNSGGLTPETAQKCSFRPTIGATGSIREPESNHFRVAIGASDTIRNGANRKSIGAFVTNSGANGASLGATGALDWREWHSLNTLTLKNHLENTDNTTGQPGQISDLVNEGLVVDQWNLVDLLSHCRVSEKCQRELVERGASVDAFVSWLLYACSAKGKNLKDPIGHALSRLRSQPQKGAGGACDRLSKLPPDVLYGLIEGELTQRRSGNLDWRAVMEGSAFSQFKALAGQLGMLVHERAG